MIADRALRAMCVEPGCVNTASRRSLCSLHYQRLRRAGLLPPLIYVRGACLICGKAAWARGYCRRHYSNLLRCGFPLGMIASLPSACKVAHCDRRAHQWGAWVGYCELHATRMRKHGDPLKVNRRTSVRGKYVTRRITRRGLQEACAEPGCDNPRVAHGLCMAHYMAARRAKQREAHL